MPDGYLSLPSSETLLQLYLQYGLDFHAGCIDTAWQRFLTPPGASMFARQNLARQLAHQYWTQQQVRPRAVMTQKEEAR